MTQWFVKNLSELTGVSVQTLHHYDRISLLKPSLRQANGYRVYSEQDLLKLQQIIALKFVGFELGKIKLLLNEPGDTFEHFKAQAQMLESKAKTLLNGAKTLRKIASKGKGTVIPWETLIQLIEMYRINTELQQSWEREIFTPEELKQYADFKTKTDASKQKILFEKNWMKLVEEIRSHLSVSPDSEAGIHLGEKCMRIANKFYGKKHAHFRTKKFEKGLVKGLGLKEMNLTPKMVAWLKQSIDAYWRLRFHDLLNGAGNMSFEDLVKRWNKALEERCGEDLEHQKRVFDMLLNDEKLDLEAKRRIKNLIE
ncbi:MerR family transcriptional regulator [Legionella santicrucis]|uniref:MerR family transcriptional regulator n=1 Tax=Legionella santicrucis TaxID=45074 RepID=A0A0W0YJT0_9GAMM|nr:MerR family transcriptional regulator [Legionella santicrucis]KTD56964.1 MerR family transcriptional regulator [Legionella santicrucis]